MKGELPTHGPAGTRPQRLYPTAGPFEFGAEDGQAGNDDDGAGSRYEQENDTEEDDDHA